MASAEPQNLGWLRPGNDTIDVIRDLADKMRELSGRGAAADEAVVITVDNTGTVSAVTLDPLAMRLNSSDLSALLLAAARAASDDLQAKMQTLMREALGTNIGDIDPQDVTRQTLDNTYSLTAGLSNSLARIEADVERSRAQITGY